MTNVENKPEAPEKPLAAKTEAVLVDQILAGRQDSTGETIDRVYYKRKDYAIYRRDSAPPEVVVKYSDEPATEAKQIEDISAPLLPLRDHLIHLINDLPPTSQESYRAQVADALRLGLEKQVPAAHAVLSEAITDALEAQGRRGRLVYLVCAGIATVPALILFLIGGSVASEPVRHLLMSAGAGAIGAVSSIAIGIRARTVAIEGNWKSNAVDAAVRVAIGIISAAVLFLLLSSGAVPNIIVGDVSLTADIGTRWQVALIVGFVAGFLERLVPDLLEKRAPAKLATGAAGVAPPSPVSG